MPDDENSTAVADTNVEPSTGTEAEDAGTKLEELVTEGEVGTQTEQEAEKPEQESEQETEPSFDEQLEAAKGRFAELKESDPEQYAKLTEVLGGDDVAAQRTALEQEKAGLLAAAESQAAFAGVQQAYEPARQAQLAKLQKFAIGYGQVANRQAKDDGQEIDPQKAGKLYAELQQEVAAAGNTGRATGLADSFLEARTAALTSTLGAQFTAEELTELGSLTWQDAITKPQDTYGKLINVIIQAAVRAAPEAAVKAGVAKSEATVKATELLGGLMARVSKNGKGQPSAAASSQPRNETEARNLHAEGKWTTRQMRTYLAKNRA